MESENQTQEKPIEVKVISIKDRVAIIAIIISVIGLCLSMYSIIRPFDKEEINVTSGDELNLFRGLLGGTLVAEQDISLVNVGKRVGNVASIEGLIVSQKKDKEGIPIFKKRFYEIIYFEKREHPFGRHYTFFNWVIFPNEWLSYRLQLNQEKARDYDYNHKEFDNFDAGDYEYLLVLKNDMRKRICVKHYQFSVNKPDVDSLMNEVPRFFSLTPLQNKKRVNELLKISDALKIAKN